MNLSLNSQKLWSNLYKRTRKFFYVYFAYQRVNIPHSTKKLSDVLQSCNTVASIIHRPNCCTNYHSALRYTYVILIHVWCFIEICSHTNTHTQKCDNYFVLVDFFLTYIVLIKLIFDTLIGTLTLTQWMRLLGHISCISMPAELLYTALTHCISVRCSRRQIKDRLVTKAQ